MHDIGLQMLMDPLAQQLPMCGLLLWYHAMLMHAICTEPCLTHLFVRIFHSPPCVSPGSRISRSMQQHQVQVLEVHLLQTVHDGCHGLVIPPIVQPDLAGDKDLMTGDATVIDCITNIFLVAVYLCCVNVPAMQQHRDER